MEGHDVCGIYASSHPEILNNRINIRQNTEEVVQNFPKYTFLDERLKTFEDWPQGMPVKPEILAASGFYYTGK